MRNLIAMVLLVITLRCIAQDKPPLPTLIGDPWTIARDPDLGELTDPKQQPVDFAIWPAADGSWQLLSCIRSTKEKGKTRLFHRWEGAKLTDSDWKPMGVAMRADDKLGETPGGLQAPHVIFHEKKFHMFYGDWENICHATSDDGKAFTRVLKADGKPALFTQGAGNNTRDAMVIRIKDLWHCYYTAYPQRKGAVYCRTSKDFATWSDAKIVAFGGQAGTNAFSAECPFVIERTPGQFYLFRTQKYGKDAITRVYCSNDPMDFGIEDDTKLVTSLPVAAPEIIEHEGKQYMAYLLGSLKGICVQRMEWRNP